MALIRFEGDERDGDRDGEDTILAVALRAGVPLAHACGGRAKCTTCRVLVLSGLEACGGRGEAEDALAKARRLTPDVRLACQTRPAGDVVVRRLVTDEEDASLLADEVRDGGGRSGEERRLGILFCDVRDFTPFAEAQPAYDVVHVLNRWFRRAHAAVLAHGGRVDAYLGDGLMALFDAEEPGGAALGAVRAGLALVAQAREFDGWFRTHFHRPFRIGVGVHVGEAILGTVGTGEGRRLTAIGDAVNLAARVEAANKAAGTSLLVTEDARREVEALVRFGRRVDVPIKGKSGTHALYEALAPDEVRGA